MTPVYSEAEIVARVEGLTVTRLRRFAAARCVRPLERDGGPAYREEDVARLHLLCELGADFDMDEEAAALVLSLIDQVHGLRASLRAMAASVAEEPEEVRRRIVARAAAQAGGGRAG